ncbi:MAG: hypothetical protein V4487_08115 [Chlamydiota bacterium]
MSTIVERKFFWDPFPKRNKNESKPKAREKMPHVLQKESFRNFGCYPNSFLLNKKWKFEHDKLKKSAWCNIKGDSVVKVLFPELALKEGPDFGDLNQKIRKLFSVLPKGKEEYKKIDQEFSNIDKTVCAERFKKLASKLSEMILEVERPVPSRAVNKVWGLSLPALIAIAVCMCLFHIYGIAVVLVYFLLMTIGSGSLFYKHRKQTSFVVNQAFNGRLVGIQEALRLPPPA